jgi:hypothetical protein
VIQMLPVMKQELKLYQNSCVVFSTLIIIVCAIFSAPSISETRVVGANLPHLSAPPTLYAGFSRLLDDETILIPEELLDVKKGIKRIAFYHNGDRLHRNITKQVHLMIENKLLGKFMGLGRFEVIDCIECRTTRVNFESSRMHVSQSAQSNQDLRSLSKEVRVDAFVLWSASVHEDKFTVNLRMVESKSNELLWLKEYAKKTTREEEELEFETTQMEMTISSFGLGGEREGVGLVADAKLARVTAFGLRRRESTTLNKDIEYSLGAEYFRNFSAADEFNVSGINLEGRVFVRIEALSEWVNTKAYVGVGQAFFSGSHGLVMKLGLEFPFVTNGFMALGVVYVAEETVEWDANSSYQDSSEFGGSGLDITLGYRF